MLGALPGRISDKQAAALNVIESLGQRASDLERIMGTGT